MVFKYVSKGSKDNVVVCSLRRERLACFSQPRWHCICCSVLSPQWVFSLIWCGFSNADRLGLSPVLYLADSPHYGGVLPDSQWQGTSNQLSGFTFVCNLKIIVFALYDSTYPPGGDVLEQVPDVIQWSSMGFHLTGWTSWEGKWDFIGHWTAVKFVSYVFTQFPLFCAVMLRQTLISARTDGTSHPPWVASVQHISFGHLTVWEREEYIYNSPTRVNYSPLLCHCLCLHDVHFPSCKELSRWQHNNFAFLQHKNSIP